MIVINWNKLRVPRIRQNTASQINIFCGRIKKGKWLSLPFMKKSLNLSNIKTTVILVSLVMLALIFASNYYIQSATTIPVLYVVPIFLTLFYPGRKITIYISIIAELLLIAGFLISPKETAYVINHLVSFTGIGIGFAFIIAYKNHALTESKNKERLRAMFEYATEGILIANKKGEIIMINPIAERQFGYDPGELVGKQIEVLIPQRLSERHVKHREKYVHNPYPRSMGQGLELYAKRKNGSEFPVEISLSNFSTDEGAFVIAFVIDITQRKKSEELFRKEKEIAQMYLDIAPVLFVVIGNDEKVILINQNGCRMLACQENEIIDKNWFDFFIPEDERENTRTLFRNLLSGKIGAPGSVENEIINARNERKLISWKNTIIRDEKGNAVATLSAGEDVTDKKSQENLIEKANADLKRNASEILALNANLEKRVQIRTEELAELINKLEHTNSELAIEIKERKQAEELLHKNREDLRVTLEKEKELSELKSRFVTMASHEFRTPLSTILSSVSLISKYNDPGQDEKRFKHIERIKSSVNNLTSILNDFLSLGKLEEGKIQSSPSTFNLVSFSQELVNELREVTKKGQVIHYNHEGDSEMVFLDKNLTRNICINLLSNAIKYSGEGSEIQFLTFIKNNSIKIEITDQGIGIPQTEQQHIFERFFRAKNAGNIQGTGLGLNIVKKYVDLLNGEIQFFSINEKGTTFTVTFSRKPFN